MSTSGKIAKNTLFNMIATVSDVAINLVVGIVLVWGIADTEQYGLYAFLMWFLGVAALVANLGLGEMAKRFIAESLGRENISDPEAIVRMTFLVRGIAAIVVAVVILVFSGFWARTFADPGDRLGFVLIGFALAPNVLNLAFVSVFAGFQKYEYAAYLILGTNPLRAVLIAVILAFGLGIEAVLIVNLSVWVIGVLIGLFLLRRLVPLRTLVSPPRLAPAVRRGALKYALTIAGVLGVELFLWGQAEVMLLGLFRSVEDVGFYTLASKLPLMAMTLVPSVLGVVLLPVVAEQFGRGDMDKLRNIYVTSARYLMMLALPMAAAGIALAGPVITLLYPGDYLEVVGLMQIVFIPFAARGISYAATSVLYGVNRPSVILKVGLVLIGLNVGLNYWLIHTELELAGAAVASSVPRLLALVLYALFASRIIGVAWPLRDTVRIALACLVMGLTLFYVQGQLGSLLSLVVSVPLGLGVYAFGLLALRVIRQKDLAMLEGILGSLPDPVGRGCRPVMNLAAKLVVADAPVSVRD